MKNYEKLALCLLLSAVPAFSQTTKPLEGLNIMLDPGHGGKSSGAVGKLGLRESDTNMRVARYLKSLLEYDGAKVSLTRKEEDKDKEVTLAERVELANKADPDLYLSIHHNSTLHYKPVNKTEIYYNAVDNGISRIVAECLSKEFSDANFAGESTIIPGGFYVLRKNQVPALLLEGSYICIPESEKNLRSGKGLTEEARIIWKALRNAYKKGPTKVEFFAGNENKLIVNSPYFNLLFTSNKAISNIKARIDGEGIANVGIKNVMAYPMTYSLYNIAPLKSGEYSLTLSATSYDGMPAAPKKINLVVALPSEKAVLAPVAPFIPLGFKGRFPINVKVLDEKGNLNSRSQCACLSYNGKKTEFLTDKTGLTTVYIDLSGKETKELYLNLEIEGVKLSTIRIPVAMPVERFVLGRLVDENKKPIAKASIDYKGKTLAVTSSDGNFYFSYPLNTNSLTIDIHPICGYNNFTKVIETSGEPVVLPELSAKAVAPALMDKKIAVIAPDSLNQMVRNLVKPLIHAGAKVNPITLSSKSENPIYEAVFESNLMKDLDFLISLKTEKSNKIQIRYYYSSERGNKLAQAVKATFKKNYPNIEVEACSGPDYELKHSGAVSLVISIPTEPDDQTRKALIDQLTKALSSKN